jgi:hypothetical protein
MKHGLAPQVTIDKTVICSALQQPVHAPISGKNIK